MQKQEIKSKDKQIFEDYILIFIFEMFNKITLNVVQNQYYHILF